MIEKSIALLFALIGALLMFAAVAVFYGALAAFVWNDFGLDFSHEFNAADLTFKQVVFVGMMVLILRFRVPNAPAKKEAAT